MWCVDMHIYIYMYMIDLIDSGQLISVDGDYSHEIPDY